MREVFNLRLNANLVVLSSCQTGLGQFIKGEGIEGISRAFFYAGSSSVVMSLWTINDQVSSQFMERFYYHLKNSEDLAQAIRQAKLEMIDSGVVSHPYYWAGFILSGDGSTRVFRPAFNKTLIALGALVLWSGSEAVLPAYLVGMVLAEFSNGDSFWIRRLRTLTVGFLTPFYFLRAGTFVSLPALIAAPVVFLLLLGGKVISKIFGLYPIIGQFRRRRDERWYYTLMMSTGLTFGTISALYGLSHNIVTQVQYSFLVAVVITSAVVPTLIAGIAFLPRHLLPQQEAQVGIIDERPDEEG